MSSGLYAEKTDVTPERSRMEIERTLTRYGASAFGYGWQEGRAVVSFKANDRFVQFVIELPDPRDVERTPSGRERKGSALNAAHEAAIRQKWRALSLCIKAKLEAVASGIASFEEEFLANIVLPNGSTVGELLAPQIENAYENGAMPAGLPLMLTSGEDR